MIMINIIIIGKIIAIIIIIITFAIIYLNYSQINFFDEYLF